MAHAASLALKDPLALVGIAAFVEELRGDQVTNQASHLLQAERRLAISGAEGMVPHGRGEIGKAVAGAVRFERQHSAVASGATLGYQ